MNIETLETIIIRSMQEGVVIIECSGVVSALNPSACRILGLHPALIKGSPFQKLCHNSDNNAEFIEIFDDLINNGKVTPHREIQFIRQDGQAIELFVSSAALDIQECVEGMESYVVVFRDITAFKNLEKAKLKAVNHISHELKTPLSILRACFTALLDLCSVNQKAIKIVDRGYRNVDRLLSTQIAVEQILNPAKSEPQKIPVTLTINHFVEQIISAVQHRHISVKTEFDYTNAIDFDPALLEIILSILIKNSFENTPDNGLIIVRFSQIDSGQFEISVQDYGVGIPLTDFEFIFEGFHHTQDTDEYATKRPFDFNAGGKGLELLQLKNLCEANGFYLDFDSERCGFIPRSTDHCPGDITLCPYVKTFEDCYNSGWSIFRVNFTNIVT
jgi:PAS domain S-box-containing protein